MFWDYLGSNPESLYQVRISFYIFSSSLHRTVAADFATIAVVLNDRRHAYSFELAR